ncbi:MAG: hypothetical protein ACOCRK_07600, partial [bacterium]
DLINLDEGQAVVFFDELDKPIKVDIERIKVTTNLSFNNNVPSNLQKEESFISIMEGESDLKEEINKLIHTYILFPYSVSIDKEVKDMFSRYTSIVFNETEYNDFKKEIFILYLENCINNKVIKFIIGENMINNLKENSEIDFSTFRSQFLNNIELKVVGEDSIYNISDVYLTLNSIWAKEKDDIYLKKNITKVIIDKGTNSTIYEEIIAISGIRKIVNTSLLDHKQIKELVDSIVLVLFDEESATVDGYFGINKGYFEERNIDLSSRGKKQRYENNLAEINDEVRSLNHTIKSFLKELIEMNTVKQEVGITDNKRNIPGHTILIIFNFLLIVIFIIHLII